MFFYEHHGMDTKDLFHVNRLTGESFPAHLHRACEIILVNAGELTIQVEQTQQTLHEKELVFLFPNQIHGFSAGPQTELTVVLFSPELISDFYAAHKGMVPNSNILYLNPPPAFENLGSIYAQKSILYQLCDTLIRSTGFSSGADRASIALIQRIFAFIDNHYTEDCTLKNMARILQYDYAYLSKLFSRMTGTHFTEYVNYYRISQACLMLKESAASVQEVACACGYSGLRTFHRNFRAIVGCSPQEYRLGF